MNGFARAAVRRTPFVLAGLVLGSGLGIGAVAMAVDGDEPLPPEKQAVVDSVVPGTLDLPQVVSTVREVAIDDSGPAAQVAAIKAAVPAILEAYTGTMAMPVDLDARALSLTALKPDRIAALLKVWTPATVVDRTASLLQEVTDVVADQSYAAFDENRFVLGEWMGVDVADGAATAFLNGHMEYRSAGEAEWRQGNETQYQLTLKPGVLGFGGWQLQDKKQLILDGDVN